MAPSIMDLRIYHIVLVCARYDRLSMRNVGTIIFNMVGMAIDAKEEKYQSFENIQDCTIVDDEIHNGTFSCLHHT